MSKPNWKSKYDDLLILYEQKAITFREMDALRQQANRERDQARAALISQAKETARAEAVLDFIQHGIQGMKENKV